MLLVDAPQTYRFLSGPKARPHAGAAASTPLKWGEVRSTLNPARFTIQPMPARLAKLGDLWAPVLGESIDLRASLRRMEKLFK